MAAGDKTAFAIDLKISPYGECKFDDAPTWFAARPKLAKLVDEIAVKRSLMLDPRKWKKKTLEEGVYAVARYPLATWATGLLTSQKEIDKVIPPKDQKKRKFKPNDKGETKEEKEAFDAAEKRLMSLWRKVSKEIEDKVSLALDDVEADKGDNKKALAAGREAIKIFTRIDTSGLFARPIANVARITMTLAMALRAGHGHEEAYAVALRDIKKVERDYEFIAKSTSKVAKMFLAIAERTAKDKTADKEILDFGKLMAQGPVKKNMLVMIKNVSEVGKDLDGLVNFIAKGEASALQVAQRGMKFQKEHQKRRGSAKATTASMRDLAVTFKKIEKKLK